LRKHIGRSLAHTAPGPAAVLFCSVAALSLAGCSVTPYTDTSAHTLSIKGTAFGGQPPISGASISIYATGQTGYGLSPSFLGGATTDSNGNFQVTSYTPCSDPEEVYLVASGGNPGLAVGTHNNAIMLVAALGKCSSVGASTIVNVNEVTTIAAAYALSGFANVANFSIGTSATNASGLQHAFLNAANIVDTTTGAARGTTPSGNGTVPASMINTLADILEPCVNSLSGSSTACSTLFANAKPPSVTGIATPTNTWQAALDMAQYPGNNVGNLFGLVLGSPSFQPTIGSTAPNDLSLGILYSAGFQTNGTTAASFPFGIAADASDNIWITGMASAGLVELSSNGTLLSPAGGWGNASLQAASTHQVAVDLHGNIITADNGTPANVYVYSPGSAVTTTIQPGGLPLSGVAIDSNNNIWFSSQSSATSGQAIGQLAYNSGSSAFASAPTAFSASTALAGTGTSALTVDAKTNNVWAPNQSSGLTNYFFSPYNVAPGQLTTGDTTNYAAAVDKNGDLWITGTKTGANAASLFQVSHINPTGTPKTVNAPGTGSGLNGSQSIMIDGNDRIFVNSATAGTIVEYDPSLGTGGTFFLSAGGSGFNPVNSASTGIIVAGGGRSTAIDAAGAIWTVNSTAGSVPVVQILGIAAPTVPILAQGKYGAKP
jgi:hypothetical protein